MSSLVGQFRSIRPPDLPVLTHEMRVRQRGARPFVVMFIYTAVLSVVALLVLDISFASMKTVHHSVPAWVQMPGGSGSLASEMLASYGRRLFGILSVVQLAMIVLIVPAYSSGSVTTEKEKGTFESLALTLMGSSSIITQKMAAAIFQALMLTLANVPVVATVFFLGGVSPLEVALVYLLLIVTAEMLGAMAMFCSCILGSTRASLLASYIAALVFMLGVPLIGGWLSGIGHYGVFNSIADYPLTFTLMFAFVGAIVGLMLYTPLALILRRTTDLWRTRAFRMGIFGGAYTLVLLIFSVPALTDALISATFGNGIFLPLYVNPFFAMSLLLGGDTSLSGLLQPSIHSYHTTGYFALTTSFVVTATLIFGIGSTYFFRQISSYRFEAARRV